MSKKTKKSKSDAEVGKLIERDLTALAREKKLPSAHGVDASFAEVVALLEQNRKAPLLAGEPGVGKRALVQEPSLERSRWILGRVATELEEELPISIDPAACDMALRLSARFLLARRLPRKALELLREAAAEAAGAGKEKLGAEDVLGRFCT